MNKILILIPFLMSCTSIPKIKPKPKPKHRYEERFCTGCMNGYIHQAEKDSVKVDEEFLHNAYNWCVKAYEEIENTTRVIEVK